MRGGKEHRFGRGFQVNALLIPVAARPRREELASRWRGEEANRTLAEFVDAPGEAGTAAVPASMPKERRQPGHGLLFTATPTLFGRVYNSYYCDGTQGLQARRADALALINGSSRRPEGS